MRYVLLVLLLVASVMEYASQGRLGFGMVTGLYFFLLIQADHAAKRYLRHGLILPATAGSGASIKGHRIRVEDVLDLPPLGGRRSPGPNASSASFRETPREKQAEAAPPKAKVEIRNPAGFRAKADPKRAETKQAGSPRSQTEQTAAPKQSPPPPAREPNFRGPPHQVLAVAENAATYTIVRAFRHWVKQYHPDRARDAQRANDQTRCLTDAKDKLLQQRKQMRKPKAA